jgi:hypothetical protein
MMSLAQMQGSILSMPEMAHKAHCLQRNQMHRQRRATKMKDASQGHLTRTIDAWQFGCSYAFN